MSRGRYLRCFVVTPSLFSLLQWTSRRGSNATSAVGEIPPEAWIPKWRRCWRARPRRGWDLAALPCRRNRLNYPSKQPCATQLVHERRLPCTAALFLTGFYSKKTKRLPIEWRSTCALPVPAFGVIPKWCANRMGRCQAFMYGQEINICYFASVSRGRRVDIHPSDRVVFRIGRGGCTCVFCSFSRQVCGWVVSSQFSSEQ